MDKKYHISTMNSGTPIERVHLPKVIARISLCGALTVNVTDNMDWNPPTPEQIKNLKEMLNIDVILMEDKDDN